VEYIVYPFRPPVRITGSLLAARIRVYEAVAGEFPDHRIAGFRVQVAAYDPGVCRPIGFDALVDQLSDLPISNMFFRRLIVLSPFRVRIGDPDNPQLALEAAYQGEMAGIRRAVAPIAVIERLGARQSQPFLPEKRGAAVRFVASFLRINAVIAFRAEAPLKQGIGVSLDLL